MPYLMRSKVKRLLEGARDQQPLLKFIDEAMVVADRKHILEVFDAAEDLSVSWIMKCQAVHFYI